MPGQAHDWTCSVCSVTWVLQSTGVAYTDWNTYDARYDVGVAMGYPECINYTYGCMSTQCVKDVLATYGLHAESMYCTFDQAYAIMSHTTGTINPQGMYHFMACRGVDYSDTPQLWVANSAQGYRGVWDTLSRDQFNSLGPVELVYLVP